MLTQNNKEYLEELQKRKEEAISELYLTGRYKGLYMGKESKCKDNPIKAYIAGWMKSKGWKKEKIEQEMDDYYNEVFTEFCKIKIEKWPDILENPRKMTATLCLMVQRHLFRDVNEKYPKAKSYHEKGKLFSTSYNKNMGVVNHRELFETKDEIILEDIPNTPFETKYGVTVDDFMSLMTDDEKKQFYQYLGKRGTGKSGRYTNQDRMRFEEILESISDVCHRIKNDLNK